MKENIFLDIPAKDYHADAAAGLYMSSHNLAQFRACPHTYHLLMTGKMKRPESPALVFGRAVHSYTLEGHDAFHAEFTVTDGPINERTGKPYGRDTQKFIDFMAKQDKEIVTFREFEQIERMATNVWEHADGKVLLEHGWPELTVRCEDFHGIPVQIRLDWFNDEYGIVDLKTTSDLEGFDFQAHSLGYAFQLGLYQAVLEQVSGVKYPVYLLASEKKEPYRAACYKFSDDVLAQAEEINEKAIAEFIECRDQDKWPTRFAETRMITRL